MEKKYRLHPSVNILHDKSGELMIRMVDGEGITFGPSKFPIVQLLEQLRDKAYTFQSLVELELFSNFSDGLAKLINILSEKQIIITDHENLSSKCHLGVVYDHISRRAVRPKPYNATDFKTPKVSVVGNGLVADASCSVLKKLQWYQSSNTNGSVDTANLILVCADFDNFSLFNKMNEQFINSGLKALYIWKSASKLFLGPLVVPHETACFHCYQERAASNVHFIEEFEATTAQTEASFSKIVDQHGILGGLLEFLVMRHINFITQDVSSLVRPGDVYEFQLITGEMITHPLIKLPRCPVCGQAREDSLTYAIRNLL